MFTPSTIGLEFKNTIRKLTELKTVIEITGVYFDRKGHAYGEVYYDKLKDRDNNEDITLLVPKDKKALLTDGNGYKLRCLVKYKLSSERSIELLLNVEEIIDKEIGVDPRKQETIRKKCAILNTFHSRTYDNLSLLLKSEIRKKHLPTIALIQPLKNDTLDDIKAGLGEYWDKYSFKYSPGKGNNKNS
jgi:hypothetical protein